MLHTYLHHQHCGLEIPQESVFIARVCFISADATGVGRYQLGNLQVTASFHRPHQRLSEKAAVSFLNLLISY